MNILKFYYIIAFFFSLNLTNDALAIIFKTVTSEVPYKADLDIYYGDKSKFLKLNQGETEDLAKIGITPEDLGSVRFTVRYYPQKGEQLNTGFIDLSGNNNINEDFEISLPRDGRCQEGELHKDLCIKHIQLSRVS